MEKFGYFEMKKRTAQSSIEYMILYAIVVAVVLVGFRAFLTRTKDHGEEYYNHVADEINTGTEAFNSAR